MAANLYLSGGVNLGFESFAEMCTSMHTDRHRSCTYTVVLICVFTFTTINYCIYLYLGYFYSQ